jgi:hypothetical protein
MENSKYSLTNHPNNPRFQMLAIENSEIKARLTMLAIYYNRKRRVYEQKMTQIHKLNAELDQERIRQTNNDFDEGERCMRIKVLIEEISRLGEPEPPDTNDYRIQKANLKMRLRENRHKSNYILVWQAKLGEN